MNLKTNKRKLLIMQFVMWSKIKSVVSQILAEMKRNSFHGMTNIFILKSNESNLGLFNAALVR